VTAAKSKKRKEKRKRITTLFEAEEIRSHDLSLSSSKNKTQFIHKIYENLQIIHVLNGFFRIADLKNDPPSYVQIGYIENNTSKFKLLRLCVYDLLHRLNSTWK
jgi:hypothetical protein